MIIALLDYMNYRRKTGRYSGDSIKSLGGRLASVESFPASERPEPGQYIVVHTRDSFLSWLVMYFTDSVWSHSAIAVDDGNIVEVTLGGTIEHPFTDCLNESDYIIASHDPITPDQRQKIVETARSHVGVAKFGYYTAARLGWRIISGRHNAYRVRLTVDLLTVLFAVCYLGRHNRRFIGATLIFAALYLGLVLANCKYRRREVFQSPPAEDAENEDGGE